MRSCFLTPNTWDPAPIKEELSLWKKRILCLALVICAAAVLTACQQQDREIYPDEQPTAAPTFTPKPADSEPVYQDPIVQNPVDLSGMGTNYDTLGYNPEDEEDGQAEEIIISVTAQPATPAPIISSAYAGATPVVIDPIDKPTPTPVPKIEYKDTDYVTYEAGGLHLSFQGPAGWILEGPKGWGEGSDALDTYTLTDPNKDLDYAAQVKIRVVPVNKQYTTNELTKEVTAARDSVRSDLGFSSFEKYGTANYNFIKVRDGDNKDGTPKYSFIKNKGVYTRFKGTLKSNGAKVAGRVIINCYNKTLYILVCSYPGGDLTETFEDVYRKVRDTLIIQ